MGGGQEPSSSELAELLKDMDEKVERLLNHEGIYAVGSYGWMNHDEADPDYIGHMIWQTDPPFQPDFETILGGGLFTYEPTERDEVLTRNGEDFVAVMNAARRSIGNALIRWQAINPRVVGDSDEFWENYSISTMLLAIAADRMRDFLVMALENIEYASSRNESDQKASVQRAIDRVPGLASLASKLQVFKKVRNEIVHRVTMLAARKSLNSIEMQRATGPFQADQWKYGTRQSRSSKRLWRKPRKIFWSRRK